MLASGVRVSVAPPVVVSETAGAEGQSVTGAEAVKVRRSQTLDKRQLVLEKDSTLLRQDCQWNKQ